MRSSGCPRNPMAPIADANASQARPATAMVIATFLETFRLNTPVTPTATRHSAPALAADASVSSPQTTRRLVRPAQKSRAARRANTVTKGSK